MIAKIGGFKWIAFLLASTVVFGAAHPSGSGAKPAPALSSDAVRKHVYFLASDELAGRLPGTPGAEKAARYIADEFKRAGLKTLGKNWFQEFLFVAELKLGPSNRLQATVAGKPTAAKLTEDFLPLAFSASNPIEGEVVFAGFGISAAEDMKYDDYAGIDVRDKIVMVLPHGPEGSNPHTKFGPYVTLRHKATTAKNRGAKALVVISDDETLKDSSLAKLRYDENFGDAGLPAVIVSRVLASELLKSAQADVPTLEKRIAEARKPESFAVPGVRLSIQTDIVKLRKQGKNVVGVLEGADPTLRNEVLVIGAHYDHLGLGGPFSLAPKEGDIHNGADDNASGTAGVIELARAFASSSEKPKRTVVFIAFSAEERGLLGSAYYADHPLKPLAQTVAMFNMDMIGRMRENKLVVQGVGTSPDWRPTLDRINAEAKFALTYQEDGFGPSDHTSFYKKEIPVLFFFTGNHEDYHRPTDDADKINYLGEARILDFIFKTAAATASQPARPPYKKAKGDDPAQRTGGGFRVYLGTIPDYAAEVEGVKLSGVREGSPSEKAGIKAGDVIVELAGRTVKSVYDYTYVLQEMKPGVEVDVVVLRGSERLTLKLTPGKR